MVMDLIFLIEERRLHALDSETHSFYFEYYDPNENINSKFSIDSASFKRFENRVVPENPFDYFAVLANFYFQLDNNFIKEFGDVNVFYENSLLNVSDPSSLRFNDRYNVKVPFRTKEQLYSFVRKNGFDIGHLTLGGNPKKILKDLKEGKFVLELIDFEKTYLLH